jgi:type IV pilus assembly protein PilB
MELTEELKGVHDDARHQRRNRLPGAGCNKCRETGFSGRCGLYEMLVLDDHLRDMIATNPNVTEFRRMCIERGMVSLREDGFRKIADGVTTIKEVMRVTEATI